MARKATRERMGVGGGWRRGPGEEGDGEGGEGREPVRPNRRQFTL